MNIYRCTLVFNIFQPNTKYIGLTALKVTEGHTNCAVKNNDVIRIYLFSVTNDFTYTAFP